MSTTQIMVLVVMFVIVDSVLVLTVLALAKSEARGLANKFPALEPGPDAVTRRFQSFKIDIINLGWSMHASVDERHLHLRPALAARLIGVKACSLPWDAIRVVRAFGAMTEVRVGMVQIDGPSWCFELASAVADG